MQKRLGLISTAPRDVSLNPSPESNSIYGGVAVSSPPVVPVPSIPETTSNSVDNSTFAASPAANPGKWSTSVQTLLDQPPSSLPQKLVLGGLVFCTAFAAWAAFGQIEEVGHAQGRLVPQGEVYKIDPVEMGKVVKIAVKEGESVKAGQVLVELNTEMAESDVTRLGQMLTAYQLELSQKQALLSKAYSEARTRSEIAQANADAQKAAIAQAEAKVAAIQALLREHQTGATADRERIARLQPLTATAEQLLQQRQADVAAQKERLQRLQPLVADGAISKEVVFQAEQNLRDRQSAITQSQLTEATNTQEQVFQAQQSLRDRQNAITQNEGELRQALAQITALKAELAQKQAEGQRTQIEAQQQIQQLEVEATQLKAKIAETQNLLNQSKTKLKERYLYAPVDGVVSSLNVRNIGEVVEPSQTIAEVAPKNAPLILLASLPNQEAGFVKTGMSVQVRLDAYPYQDYGLISGKVTSISPDTKPDQQLGSIYQVKVALDRNSVTDEQGSIQFKAGQTASADIIIRRRRIADILLDPIRQLQKGGMNL
ncbi:MAG TPA: HlyD family efflux transporter periplasmic adaptor subunit [Coleofasciculaceae cyanobacterium]